jgi:surface protein
MSSITSMEISKCLLWTVTLIASWVACIYGVTCLVHDCCADCTDDSDYDPHLPYIICLRVALGPVASSCRHSPLVAVLWCCGTITFIVGLTSAVFNYADNFNADVGSWDVSSVTSVRYSKCLLWTIRVIVFIVSVGLILLGCNFGGHLPFLSCVCGFGVNDPAVFGSAGNFNADIGSWDVSSVTSMSFSKCLLWTTALIVACPVHACCTDRTDDNDFDLHCPILFASELYLDPFLSFCRHFSLAALCV